MRAQDSGTDILMITFNRPDYTRLSLKGLLDTCDESSRVWIWQNGTDEATISVVTEFLDHPRVFKHHFSPTNEKLRGPTNWILSEGTGEYVSKVDDDCIVPPNWLKVLRQAHSDEPSFGALGCWHFMPEDYDPSLGERKIRTFNGGHQVLCHPWVGGSAFVLKRQCVEKVGLIHEKTSGITQYLIRIALAGWVNGWYFPLLYQEHMDDPRAPHTMLKTDEDFLRHVPLSARNFGAMSLEQWDDQLRRSAANLLRLPSNPRHYTPFRQKLRALSARLTSLAKTR